MKKSIFARMSIIMLGFLLFLSPLATTSSYADDRSGGGSSWGDPSSGGSSWMTADTLAQLANSAFGNDGYTAGTIDEKLVLDAARIFCGPGFSLSYQTNGTYYLSQNRLKRVRVSTKASGIYQANFEKFSRTGYSNADRDSNYHVNITMRSSGGSGW